MTEAIAHKNQYNLLLKTKQKADKSLRSFFVKKNNFYTATSSILDVASLKIKGGDQNLSANFDKYLYS